MPIRVLIVDDSNFMRKALSKLISSDPDIEVVGLASSGEEALRDIPRLKPDVVTLDIEMGGMDGLTALERIMEENPLPVIMFSAHTRRGAEVTVKSLQRGAVDFMEKPSGAISMDLGAVRQELIKKLRVAARTAPAGSIVTEVKREKRGRRLRLKNPESSVIAIGSSTGGVQALHSVIPKLPKSVPTPVVIVQHMPPLFTKSLAEGLDSTSSLTVKEAEEGDVLRAGHVYIAPGALHMTLRSYSGGVSIHLDKEPEDELLRPSVDILFESIAQVYGGAALAVILTGMGNDGLRGMKLLKKKGAVSIAQNEASCSVYGMPKFIVDGGLADRVLPVGEIAKSIENAVKR